MAGVTHARIASEKAESQNAAAKIHLAASLKMGDWLRNQAVKAEGTLKQGQDFPQLQAATTGVPTYADLGIEKTDAFRLQRLWDWEQGILRIVAIERTGVITKDEAGVRDAFLFVI